MKLDLPIHTYDSYGGAVEFAPVMALVELCSEDFGSALQEIELCLVFRCSDSYQPQDSDFRDTFNEFHNEYCARLPERRFLRKKARLTLKALAEFATAEETHRLTTTFILEWQHAVLDLLIGELKACRRKFKATDDFRLDDFITWLQAQHQNLPRTQEEAKALDAELRRKQLVESAQMSDWEQLGLDWEDYHPNAREVVTDPRLWSLGHEFAPNGNDDGADILGIFREQKSRWKRGGGKAFYNNLAEGWGFSIETSPADTIEYDMYRRAAVALPFVFLKLFAECPNWLAYKAISVIDGYKSYLETHDLDWDHRDECLEYQGLMLECLRSCPRS